MSTPFSTSLRRDPTDSRGLKARIDGFMSERLQSAIDDACLDLLVQVRRARNLPPPVAESEADRAAFYELVGALLDRLEASVPRGLTPEQLRRVSPAPAEPTEETARRVAVQVALAKLVPDYWQRFEALRAELIAAELEAARRGPGLLGPS